ncbi:hypothetical protein ACIBTW_07150 [Micromonospora parva]|uniref:hypothetical protein n=1 Tax=Micromonospora parva TaxID=1464048 RepID=UPI0037A98F95
MATLRDALAPGKALNLPAVLDRAALLDALAVLGTTTTPALSTTPTHPPRLNCAGYCQLCGTSGCYRRECIDVWASTTWMLCPFCHGHGGDPATGLPCSCYLGVVQADDTPEPVYYVTTPATEPVAYDGAPELW